MMYLMKTNTLINQMLLNLNCRVYTYNQENNLIEKSNSSGSSAYGLSELINIIDELKTLNISHKVDGDENIVISEQ